MEVLVPVLVQVMVRVEKQRGHPFPKLVRSPERRKLSCLAMAKKREIIANQKIKEESLTSFSLSMFDPILLPGP